MRYDMAIIGRGPAGLSAALNASIRNKNIIVFGNSPLDLTKSKRIDNYLGIPDINGKDLYNLFLKHTEKYNINFSKHRVREVYAMGDYFALTFDDKSIIEAVTVIVACGTQLKKDIKNEEKFVGKGIGYCATCDAALYKGKKVVIIGYNEESVSEANFINEIVRETIYVNMYKKDIDLNKDIKVINDIPVEFSGNNRAEKLILKQNEIEADGFFVIKESSKPERLVPSLKTEGSYIITNHKDMSTSIPGLFAAGDITGLPYQIMKAVGEGQVAALSAARYISGKNRIKK
ncbi:MAG: NAD(P)/FAD-dependent oxidoreductase [Peptoniphilaceae bacterium]|nr:NAD(P)/FAD-dependent oxidoreductase [Peptoniphilaceae bacterium]